MSNAALYFHPDAYDTTGPRLMGRHSAGESFLRGFLRHADIEQVHFLNMSRRSPQEMSELVRRVDPTDLPLVWHGSRRGASQLGVLNLPIPGLDDEAWLRLPMGQSAYALCGITHTTATDNVMRALSQMLLAPLHDYDALICTSAAVRSSVEAQLDGVRDYLAERFGCGPAGFPAHAEPQRVTIPLGVNVEDFRISAEDRRAWRERLDIPQDAIVALYVGRFNFRAKMNPALMALALEQAAQRTDRKLYWVNSGWAGTEAAEAQYHEPTRALCPSVEYRAVDGRPPDVRFSIWSVADFFISFSDNVQETFGLTPVEAMAAGLPCVITDWDGYRDTVRHGEDGFRIPTYAPAAGEGRDLAYAFQASWINYDNYVGAAGQFTAIDLAQAAQAIVALAEDPELRRRLGAQAKVRAREVFDWAAVIPQYQALWAEQDARRRAAPPPSELKENPFRPDPFKLFAGYPTHVLATDWRVDPAPGIGWAEAEAVLASPLAQYSNYARPTLEEARQVIEWLGERGPSTVAEVAARFPPGRRPFVRRGMLWLARFGAVVLTPPG